MKVRDTVMSDEQLEDLLGEDFKTAYSGHIKEYQAIAKAQAEISFRAGIGEVVEELEKYDVCYLSVSTTGHDYHIPLCLADTWQAKLKEWGIDEASIREEA